MSKFDELHELFKAAFEAKGAENERTGSRNLLADCERAGIIAVVTALRDEMCSRIGSIQSVAEARDMFEDILGSDAGEKVAGSSAREDEVGVQPLPVRSPATAPAPAMCVWLPHHPTGMGMLFVSKCDRELHFVTASGDCPSCGKPIKFTEAK